MFQTWKWTSIESFYHVRKAVQKYGIRDGSVVTYRAKIKLHGACAAYSIDGDGTLTVYSRTAVITPENDFCGFARYIESNRERLISLHQPGTTLIVYGEWAGQGIQKGVAVSQVDKFFAVFAARIAKSEDLEHEEFITDPEELLTYVQDVPGCYVLPWFNNAEEFVVPWEADSDSFTPTIEKMNAHVAAIEHCDPFVHKTFGVAGLGEGLVFYPVSLAHASYDGFSYLAFKAKGEKHKTIVHAAPVQAEPTVVEGLEEYVKNVLPESRLRQGVAATNDGSEIVMMTNLGKFLKWIGLDLLKETAEELRVSGLDPKDVARATNVYARNWFMNESRKLLFLMKTGLFTPRPGDLFRWHYDYNDEKLPDDYRVWLSDQRIYVPSTEINLLISLTETDMWWMNSDRFIHARVDEMACPRASSRLRSLHLRVRG